MIWLRRAIAIPLAVVFVILSLLVMVAFRVNATAGNPDFYAEQLQQVDVYHFLYEAVLPAALEESGIGGATGEASAIIAPLKPHIADVVQQTLPPEWLQAQAEYVINEVVPYVWGEKAAFRIAIPLKDRVEAGGEAIKNVLHREDVFLVLYEQLIKLITDGIMSAEGGMPAMLPASEKEMGMILRQVVPQDWLLAQIDRAVDEVVPYLTKEQAHFAVKIDITRPLEELEKVLADFLSRPETYDSLFAEMLAPALSQNLEEITQLPIDVELTEDEIIAVAKEALPLKAYQTLVHDLVGQIFAYLRGTQEELELVIPLADHKAGIAKALGQLADKKMEGAFDSLPVCTEAQLLELLSAPALEGMPVCRPLDMSYQEFKALVGLDVVSLVQPLIEMAIPDELLLTEAEVGQLFGGEGEDSVLVQVRELVREGLTFTEEDLSKFMGGDTVALEDIRQRIADGLTFTEHDLRNLVSGTGGAGAGEPMVKFEQLRSGLGTAKKLINFVWVIPFLLLLAVGALGGRQWSSKLIWAAALLAAMSLIAYVIFGPVFSATAQPRIDRTLATGFSQAGGIASLMAEKGVTLAQNAIASFINGLRNQAIAIIIASVVLIGVGVFLHHREKVA